MGDRMTSKLLRALAGEAVWPPPMWLMRQAGRHLPEYRAIRAKSAGLIEMCLTPDMATEVTLQPVQRYGFDAAILFSDIVMLPYALGQDVRLVEGKGPVLQPIRTAADMAVLDPGRGWRPSLRRFWRRCAGSALPCRRRPP